MATEKTVPEIQQTPPCPDCGGDMDPEAALVHVTKGRFVSGVCSRCGEPCLFEFEEPGIYWPAYSWGVAEAFTTDDTDATDPARPCDP